MVHGSMSNPLSAHKIMYKVCYYIRPSVTSCKIQYLILYTAVNIISVLQDVNDYLETIEEIKVLVEYLVKIRI